MPAADLERRGREPTDNLLARDKGGGHAPRVDIQVREGAERLTMLLDIEIERAVVGRVASHPVLHVVHPVHEGAFAAPTIDFHAHSRLSSRTGFRWLGIASGVTGSCGRQGCLRPGKNPIKTGRNKMASGCDHVAIAAEDPRALA